MIGLGWFEIVLVLGLVALLVMIVRPTAKPARVTDEAFVPVLSADAVDSALLRELGDVPRWRHRSAHGRVHVIEREYVPGFAFVVAALAFPFGLLALMWRSRHRAEVSVVEAEGGCRVRFVCTATHGDVRALAQAIQRAAPSVNVLI